VLVKASEFRAAHVVNQDRDINVFECSVKFGLEAFSGFLGAELGEVVEDDLGLDSVLIAKLLGSLVALGLIARHENDVEAATRQLVAVLLADAVGGARH